MMPKIVNHKRRKRGVILTSLGSKKLQTAKSEAEYQENNDCRYTLERMSERTGLAVDTLTKVFACEVAVDKQTLKRCFDAFNLVLSESDYVWPVSQTEFEELDVISRSRLLEPFSIREKAGTYHKKVKLDLLGGPVPLESIFYVERFPVESRYYELINQPGALIQITSARRMGKTSLMTRILHCAKEAGYHTVISNFQLTDTGFYTGIDPFLRHFCACISTRLGLPHKLAEYWDEQLSNNCNATHYFEHYLLPKIDNPLVLALDEINYLFQCSEIATHFCGLLRSWYEKAKSSHNDDNVWQKLRLVIVHSTEVQITHPLCNMGLVIDLPDFTSEQVQYLVEKHGLDWSTKQVNQLMALVGGHPHRVRVALYDICHLGRD
ncbi:MAG TPA: serine/threonine protein kinase [Thioploca sp.]|nr:MAG: serine/threonine protein kinase [Gammaproteobacteria bacterium]HDN25704.1 serine/threonine protein kinase [Thioploca sp.]